MPSFMGGSSRKSTALGKRQRTEAMFAEDIRERKFKELKKALVAAGVKVPGGLNTEEVRDLAVRNGHKIVHALNLVG